MNLLIFIHSLHSGGAERVTTNLANHWAQKGWRVTVVTLTSSDNDFYQLHPAVGRIALSLASDSGNIMTAIGSNLLRVQALRRVLKHIQPDAALAMMSTSNILLALAALGLKNIRTIGSERIYPPSIPLGRLWERLRAWSYGRLDAMVALTAESATWLRKHTKANQIPVIPNAIPWPLSINTPRLDVPSRLKDQHLLLAVGRLDKQKGFDLLISAFQNLTSEFSGWKLVILGEGTERSALNAQISAARLNNHISLPGRAGNVGQWYAAADLYVMSSRFEGFPNTLTEAMAHGLPAVSFDCDTGPRDIVRHEVDGLLVPAGDVAELEAALRRLMGDAILRQQMGARAVEVRERFSMERVAVMWEKLFKDFS